MTDRLDEMVERALAGTYQGETNVRTILTAAGVPALLAEVERLRALAGCAYQLAGVHDAPEIWLDRLGDAANGDPLPDPDTLMDELLPYVPDPPTAEAELLALRATDTPDARRYRLLVDSGHDTYALFVEAENKADMDARLDALLPAPSGEVAKVAIDANEPSDAMMAKIASLTDQSLRADGDDYCPEWVARDIRDA